MTTALPNGRINAAYSAQFTAQGGITPYTWAIILGNLPPGLTLGTLDGKITGIATTTGDFLFTVEVTDSSGTARQLKIRMKLKRKTDV